MEVHQAPRMCAVYSVCMINDNDNDNDKDKDKDKVKVDKDN